MKDDADADLSTTFPLPSLLSDVKLAETQDRTGASGASQLEVRCPNCHAPTDVAVDTKLTDLTCTACGSHFSLVKSNKSTWTAPSLTQMGRFELVERLGVGGFGSVWKARDNELDRTVAIKIPRQGDMTAEEQEKFFREARAAAQLRHPGIVCVHEVGRDGESVYIVSDFVRGVTLGDWLTGQQLTAREAAELCAKIADALHHAHEHGVVHRDLKPANIMIDPDGQPHLMDFGLARREVGEVTVTVDGQIMGTPAYMSPEQAQGESHKADRRSDIYSLGVILFQLLTGERPFRGNARMVMHQVIHDEPRTPRSLNDRVPRDLDTICIKCLQKEPTKRYQKADQLAADLHRFLTGRPILARPVSRGERTWRWCRRNPLVASLVATAAALLLAVAVVATAGYLNTKSALNQARAAQRAANLALQQADANYDVALDAVDEMLTVVGNDLLANVPQMEAARSRLLRKALVSYQGLLEKNPTDINTRAQVAHAYHRVADIHRVLAEQSEARDAYQHAIESFESLASDFPDEPEYRHHLGMAYDYFGELLRAGKRVKEAEEAYRSALIVQNRLVEQYPDNQKYRQELARTRNNFGILLMDTNRFESAENSMRGALRMLDELTEIYPDDVEYQQELARTNINVGNLLNKTKRASGADQAYRRAVDLLDSVVQRNPDVHDYRYKLAVSLVNLSNLRETPQDSEPDVKRAIDLLSTLSDNYPRIPLYQKELANAYNSLAAVYATTGNHRAAGENWNAARDVCQPLVKAYPDNPEYQSLFGVILGGLAWLANGQNDSTQAGQFVEQAIDLQQSAIKLNSDNPIYRERLARHQEFKIKLGQQQETAE